jgi:hypothetical protein
MSLIIGLLRRNSKRLIRKNIENQEKFKNNMN